MKINELIQNYDGAMTAKYKSKFTTFRKIEYLKKKLYDEYPNQYRVEMWQIPDEMVKEKNISEQIHDRNTWEYTDGKDIKEELIEYLKPLIRGEVNIPYENGVPKHFIL